MKTKVKRTKQSAKKVNEVVELTTEINEFLNEVNEVQLTRAQKRINYAKEVSFDLLNDVQLETLNDVEFVEYCNTLEVFDKSFKDFIKESNKRTNLHLNKQDFIYLLIWNNSKQDKYTSCYTMVVKGKTFTDANDKPSLISPAGIKRDWNTAYKPIQSGSIRINEPKEYYTESQKAYNRKPVNVRFMTKTNVSRTAELKTLIDAKFNCSTKIIGETSFDNLKVYLLNNGAKESDFLTI